MDKIKSQFTKEKVQKNLQWISTQKNWVVVFVCSNILWQFMTQNAWKERELQHHAVCQIQRDLLYLKRKPSSFVFIMKILIMIIYNAASASVYLYAEQHEVITTTPQHMIIIVIIMNKNNK